MPTLTDLLSIAVASREDFNNWKRQQFLSHVPKSKAGVSQEFTRVGALELLFFAALRNSGFEPHAAAREVRQWLAEEKGGKFAPFWAGNPSRQSLPGSLGRGFGNGKRPIESLFAESDYLDQAGSWGRPLASSLKEKATSLVVVNRQEIVARIDALFRPGK